MYAYWRSFLYGHFHTSTLLKRKIRIQTLIVRNLGFHSTNPQIAKKNLSSEVLF